MESVNEMTNLEDENCFDISSSQKSFFFCHLTISSARIHLGKTFMCVVGFFMLLELLNKKSREPDAQTTAMNAFS